MRIYPTLYRYNAPYRGPKNYKEINKVMTSIAYDIDTVKEISREHEDSIESNMDFYIYKNSECISNLEPQGEIESNILEFKPGITMAKAVNSMDDRLDNMIKNI